MSLKRTNESLSEIREKSEKYQELLFIIKDLEPDNELFGIDFQDEMNTYVCDYCNFETYGVNNPQILHDPDCPVFRIREFLSKVGES